MQSISSLRALFVAIAASASTFLAASADAQSQQPFTEQPFTEQPIILPSLSETSSLDDASFQGLPTPVLTDIENTQLSSPNIDIYNANPGIRVILIDPIEQSYFNAWEQTATTQISDINIRSAVQAPITQIRIRAGRPVIERLGQGTTDSFFFNQRFTSSLSNFPTQENRVVTFSDLPDGNYRALLSDSGIGDSGVVQDGRLFTFRKVGDSVTGDFAYIGSGETACITGILQGNTVFGNALTDGSGVQVLDKTYLGSGLSLQLSNEADDSAVLSLNGFSLVNLGTVAPPTVCR